MSTAISVVVPTRDRPSALGRCLAGLASQDAPLELVIVDDGRRELVDVGLARALGADSVVRSGGAGAARARNLGVRTARGEVVCFIDDDCIPRADWARRLAAVAAAVGVAAGATIAAPGAGSAALASHTIVEHLRRRSLDRASGRLGFAPSCNLAARRETLERLPFDESFPGAGGEDREWCARAAVAGLAPAYAPEAIVVHARDEGPGALLAQGYRYGRGGARHRREADLGLGSPAFYAALFRAGFAHGPRPGALLLAAQAATAFGVAVERIASRARRARP